MKRLNTVNKLVLLNGPCWAGAPSQSRNQDKLKSRIVGESALRISESHSIPKLPSRSSTHER